MDVSSEAGGDIYSEQFHSHTNIPYTYPENFSTFTSYTLTAKPNIADGYAFYSWTVQSITNDCKGQTVTTYTSFQNPITVSTVVESKYVTANFIKLSSASALYFPHISAKTPWQTEIALFNMGQEENVTCILMSFADDGRPIETKYILIVPNGRRQIIVGNEFRNADQIGYIIGYSNVPALQGYTKFYQDGKYRAAIPAVTEVNSGNIYITHVASNNTFWTGLSLVNTLSIPKDLTITFNTGQTADVSLNANEHKAFSVASLFGNRKQPDIKSGFIADAGGIVGLELFGTDRQLEGILLTDDTFTTLYYPHVADPAKWWTGIVAYNPSNAACTMRIVPYSADGIALATSAVSIGGREKYFGVVSSLGLPAETAWFKINSTQPITGFELFGSLDGKQLGAYAQNKISGAKQGFFAKIDLAGWTGIAFVNMEGLKSSVILSAYNNNNALIATTTMEVGPYAKVVKLAEAIFAPQDITNATFITFSADRQVVGFQLNGAQNNELLDGLSAMH